MSETNEWAGLPLPPLVLPGELDRGLSASLLSTFERLQRAIGAEDWPLCIGTAKELVEAASKAVLDTVGVTVERNADFDHVLTQAHRALDRQPGRGLSADAPIRNIAQGAKTIASQLSEIRNRYGTGHGWALEPDITEEVVRVTVDGALLWVRWALPRLVHASAGLTTPLVTDLKSGATFTKGSLASRLVDADLPNKRPADLHLLGVAIAQRAMSGTFVVEADGVTACAMDPDFNRWPAPYRLGLIEGLFLSRDGLVHLSPRIAVIAAAVLRPVPKVDEFLLELSRKIAQSSWSYSLLLQSRATPGQVVEAMEAAAETMTDGSHRQAWRDLVQALGSLATRES